MSLSDKNIIELILDDKVSGIKQLFACYYRPLVLYANEYLKDFGIAEDVVQELFIKLWESDNLFENINPTSLGTYLYTAIKNSCYTYAHKKDVLSNTEEVSQLEMPIESIVDVDEERITQVMAAVEELPERTRHVVDAVMIRDLKYREVAEELGISVNTVKFLLKEGMKRLRSRFSSFDEMILFFLCWNH